MTANELADKLVESNSVSWGSCTHEQHDNDKYFKEQASAMLRQQQAEIEALKQHWSDPQTDLIVLLREEVTLMQKYLQEQNLREHFVAWRHEK
jgi:hypothetical protein